MNFISNITPVNAADLFTYIHTMNCKSENNINKIYISIGGKINEFDIETNALCQMFPAFLQTNKSTINNATMVIIIDDFNNHDNHMKNMKCLENEFNIDGLYFILCNKICDKNFICSFISHLVIFAKQNNIIAENLLICNYIKFRNIPNSSEHKSETVIPKTIHKELLKEENLKYSNCFYNWFGYNELLYNYIYCYNTHPLIVDSSTQGLMVLLDDIRINSSTRINIDSINYSQFWEQIYDITKTNKKDDYILPKSLKDELCKMYN